MEDTRNDNREKNSSLAEIFVFLLFIFCYIGITVFHEPWFDEAQAWQIARYASLKELVFTVGHYEGHPFLWYLILAVPAKLGVSYELGLKAVGLLVSASAAWICMFKAPFPRIARLVIPFSYYFFYQNGIIVRPYGVVFLLLLICALNFHKKDEHPWSMAIPMILLCATSAFGVVLSGGIAICWVIDILSEYRNSWSVGMIIHDSRFLPLLTLLLFAIFIIFCIMPREDTYSAADEAFNSPWLCLLIALLTFPADAFMTTSPFFSTDAALLQTSEISIVSAVSAGIISLLLVILLVCFSSKKKLKYLLLPVSLYLIFSSFVYFSVHHLGVFAAYILFWCWITCEDPAHFSVGKALLEKMEGSDKDRRVLKILGTGILSFCAAVNIYWTISASVHDIQFEFDCGRGTAAFLKDTGLDQLEVAAQWLEYPLDEEEERGPGNINTVLNGIATSILCRYDSNFIYTFHGGKNIGYSEYKKIDPTESAQDIETSRLRGIPDVLIGEVNLSLLTDDKVTLKDYAAVYTMSVNQIFKSGTQSFEGYVFVRRDLLDKYNLQEIKSSNMTFEVTEEVKERFENGESMESIMAPFFDQMFGTD